MGRTATAPSPQPELLDAPVPPDAEFSPGVLLQAARIIESFLMTDGDVTVDIAIQLRLLTRHLKSLAGGA